MVLIQPHNDDFFLLDQAEHPRVFTAAYAGDEVRFISVYSVEKTVKSVKVNELSVEGQTREDFENADAFLNAIKAIVFSRSNSDSTPQTVGEVSLSTASEEALQTTAEQVEAANKFIQNNRDIFGGMFVKVTTSVQDWKNIDTVDEESINSLVVGEGSSFSHKNDLSSIELTAGENIGDKVVLQTDHIPYQVGDTAFIAGTGNPRQTAGVDSPLWEFGFGDNAEDKDMATYPTQYAYGNGVFMRCQNRVWSIVLRSSVTGAQVDRIIPRAEWVADYNSNLISTTEIGPDKQNIFWIMIGWYSTQGFIVGTFQGTDPVILHVDIATNVNIGPFVQKATLPISYRVENTNGTGGIGYATCAAFKTLGNHNPTPIIFTEDMKDNPITIGAGETAPLISFRLRQKFNKRSWQLLKTTVASLLDDPFLVRIVIGAEVSRTEFDADELDGDGNPLLSAEEQLISHPNNADRWSNIRDGSGLEVFIGGSMPPNSGAGGVSEYGSKVLTEEFTEKNIRKLSSNIEGKSDLLTIKVTNLGEESDFFASAYGNEIK